MAAERTDAQRRRDDRLALYGEMLAVVAIPVLLLVFIVVFAIAFHL